MVSRCQAATRTSWADHGLRVIDVSAPTAPAEVGSLDTAGLRLDVAVVGRLRLRRGRRRGPSGDRRQHAIGAGGGGLFDAAGRVGVQPRAATPTSRIGRRSSGDRRQHPAAPVEVGIRRHAGRPPVSRCRAATRTWRTDYAGLRVIDVTTPRRRSRSAHDTPGDAIGVAVSRGYAYVADDRAGLRVIDMSDAAAPVEVGCFDTPG